MTSSLPLRGLCIVIAVIILLFLPLTFSDNNNNNVLAQSSPQSDPGWPYRACVESNDKLSQSSMHSDCSHLLPKPEPLTCKEINTCSQEEEDKRIMGVLDKIQESDVLNPLYCTAKPNDILCSDRPNGVILPPLWGVPIDVPPTKGSYGTKECVAAFLFCSLYVKCNSRAYCGVYNPDNYMRPDAARSIPCPDGVWKMTAQACGFDGSIPPRPPVPRMPWDQK